MQGFPAALATPSRRGRRLQRVGGGEAGADADAAAFGRLRQGAAGAGLHIQHGGEELDTEALQDEVGRRPGGAQVPGFVGP